jgi:hypothetical protein
MKEEKDYTRDIAEIRSMMERSSKFMSLSGWAGILAGMYALAGAYIAWKVFDFNPDELAYTHPDTASGFLNVFMLAGIILVLAIGTAIIDSWVKAAKRGEKAWNAVSRRLLANMSAPLAAGGILILLLISKGLTGLAAPLTLLFYGLALFNAGNFTFKAIRILGLVQITLGLISGYFIEYSLLIWTLGFGLAHIVYGIYMHYRYER